VKVGKYLKKDWYILRFHLSKPQFCTLAFSRFFLWFPSRKNGFRAIFFENFPAFT